MLVCNPLRAVWPGTLGVWVMVCATWAAEPFTLDPASAGKEIQLAVPTNGQVELAIAKTMTNGPNRVTLQLTGFRSEKDGETLNVRLAQTNLVFETNQAFAQATLRVPPLRPLTRYTGSLALIAPDVPPIFWRLSLSVTNPVRPTLVVDPPTLKHVAMRKRLGREGPPTPQLTVSLREQSGMLPIEGISVIQGTVVAPVRAKFDIATNVTFFLNGRRVSLVHATNLMERSFPAGAPASLGMAFHGLSSGEYTVELKFFALNSQEANQQKLTINLHVADSIELAFLVLVGATLLSWVVYKGIVHYRERLQLQRRIADLRPGWPFYKEPVYSVMWVRTMLKYGDKLARKWLVPLDTIIERIDRVPPVVAALREAGKAEEQLHGKPDLARKRFKAIIAGHVRSISNDNMDKAAADKARAALADLNAVLAGELWERPYWEEVARVIKELQRELEGEKIPGQAEVLWEDLKPETIKDQKTAVDQEKLYAKVKLIMERRHHPDEQKELLAKVDADLEEFFFIADKAVWERLKASKLTIKHETPDSSEEPEVFRPEKFYLTTGDSELDESFLFNRGLHFEWTFERRDEGLKKLVAERLHKWWSDVLKSISPEELDKRPQPSPKESDKTSEPLSKEPDESPKPVPVETHSPRVTQFFAGPGRLKVSVKMKCKLNAPNPSHKDVEEEKGESTEMRVTKSSELGVLKQLGGTELLAVFFALMFAVISGLLTFYWKNPTFGSLQDYLSLFLWGVGVEQSKNFLQTLQTTKQGWK